MKISTGTAFGDKTIPPAVEPKYSEKEGKWFSREEMNLPPQKWAMVALNTFKSISMAHDQLVPGAYEVSIDEQDGRAVFTKKSLVHDKIIPLTGLPKQVVEEISDFWEKGDLFASLGFLHRRGYLFYGSHGTGKSSLVHEIAENIVAEGGVVFYANNPDHFNIGLTTFRQVEPDRKVVCIFEDVDAIIRKFGEATLLSLLDGENQISKVCNLATTNYPELLDKRIVGRPRRFDRVYRIGNLDDSARRKFLKLKLPKEADLNEWVKKTAGLSIASISEVIISVFCFEKTLEDAVTIVSTLTEDKSSVEYKDAGLGFDKPNDLVND